MWKITLISFLFLFIPSVITAQTVQNDSSKVRFEFLPKGLHFIPFVQI